MIELLKVDIKDNKRNIAMLSMFMFLLSYLLKSDILNILMVVFLTIGMVIDIETKSVKDKSIFYYNVFPKKRGYIIIEKLILSIIISVYFYLLINLLNYIIGTKFISIIILNHTINIIAISVLISINTKTYLISIYTNIITLTYGAFFYLLNKVFLINYDNVYLILLITIILITIVIINTRYKDYHITKDNQ